MFYCLKILCKTVSAISNNFFFLFFLIGQLAETIFCPDLTLGSNSLNKKTLLRSKILFCLEILCKTVSVISIQSGNFFLSYVVSQLRQFLDSDVPLGSRDLNKILLRTQMFYCLRILCKRFSVISNHGNNFFFFSLRRQLAETIFWF